MVGLVLSLKTPLLTLKLEGIDGAVDGVTEGILLDREIVGFKL